MLRDVSSNLPCQPRRERFHRWPHRPAYRASQRAKQWNSQGCQLHAKRLERGRFSWPVAEYQSDRVSLSHEELSLLLGGIDLTRMRPVALGRRNWIHVG